MVVSQPALLRAISQLAPDLIAGPVPRGTPGHPERVHHQAQPPPIRVLQPDIDRHLLRAARIQNRAAAAANRLQQYPVHVSPAGDVVDARHLPRGNQPADMIGYAARIRSGNRTSHEVSLSVCLLRSSQTPWQTLVATAMLRWLRPTYRDGVSRRA